MYAGMCGKQIGYIFVCKLPCPVCDVFIIRQLYFLLLIIVLIIVVTFIIVIFFILAAIIIIV